MSASSFATVADELELETWAASISARLDASAAVDDISERGIQKLLAAAIRLYATKLEESGRFPAVEPGAITATHAVLTAAMLLRSHNLSLFEIGMFCGLE
jgi:acetyl-CoA acetyltransferase